MKRKYIEICVLFHSVLFSCGVLFLYIQVRGDISTLSRSYQESPFYRGRTTYGGASAYSKQQSRIAASPYHASYFDKLVFFLELNFVSLIIFELETGKCN